MTTDGFVVALATAARPFYVFGQRICDYIGGQEEIMILCEAQKQTFNQRCENNFLARLRTLPETIFRECVYRLQDGEPPISVTRWLLTVPSRGGMQRVDKLHTLRRYIEILARHVLRLKTNSPPAAMTTKELHQIMDQERKRVDNEIAIAGGPLNSKFESIIDSMINNHAKASDRRLWLQATALMNLQRMRLAHCLEQRRKTPILEATKISQVIIQAAEADARAELADLNIRKAKQEVENDLYGAIDLDGKLLKKGQPESLNSGPAPATQSAVGNLIIEASTLSEFIDGFIDISPVGRMIATAAIETALDMMYSADVCREMIEEQAQSTLPTAGANNVENGTMRESQGAAAQACATQTSPEQSQEDTIASSGEWPRPVEGVEEIFPMLINSSVADRMAVCGVLEAMLMIIEAGSELHKQPQIADPNQESKASTSSPGHRYCTSAENLELLQEMNNGWQRLSPVGRMMCTNALEIASKMVDRVLDARHARDVI